MYKFKKLVAMVMMDTLNGTNWMEQLLCLIQESKSRLLMSELTLIILLRKIELPVYLW